jgi:hypothetical protein
MTKAQETAIKTLTATNTIVDLEERGSLVSLVLRGSNSENRFNVQVTADGTVTIVGGKADLVLIYCEKSDPEYIYSAFFGDTTEADVRNQAAKYKATLSVIDVIVSSPNDPSCEYKDLHSWNTEVAQ